MSEPIYYVTSRAAGVSFAADRGDVPDDARVIPPGRVMPEVREAGRRWLAELRQAVAE